MEQNEALTMGNGVWVSGVGVQKYAPLCSINDYKLVEGMRVSNAIAELASLGCEARGR